MSKQAFHKHKKTFDKQKSILQTETNLSSADVEPIIDVADLEVVLLAELDHDDGRLVQQRLVALGHRGPDDVIELSVWRDADQVAVHQLRRRRPISNRLVRRELKNVTILSTTLSTL